MRFRFQFDPTGPRHTGFAASPTTITTGASSALTFAFSNGTGIITPGGLFVSSGVPLNVTPLATTTFTLTVTNSTGATTAQNTTVMADPAPVTPIITAPNHVTVGAAGISASVPAQVGCTYTWTITGGSILGGSSTNQITFNPGATVSVQLGCVVTNTAGTASTQGTTTISIDPVPSIPVINTPDYLTAGSIGLTASVPAQAGCTYEWTITGGVITGGAATNQITFTAGTSGSVQLGCVVSNAAGTPSTQGTATSAIVAAPSITAFASGSMTITLGNSTILSFAFSGGTGVVTPGNTTVVSGGTLNVTPSANTTYTLSVTNAAGTVATGTTMVHAVPAPTITSFMAGQTAVGSGYASTLTAIFANGTGSVDSGIGAVISGQSKSTGPLTAETTFTLTVTNAAGSTVTAPATIKVNPGVFTALASPWPAAYWGNGMYMMSVGLSDGRVLFAGGGFYTSVDNHAAIFDPASTFALTGSLNTARALGTATTLPGGKLLVAGGAGNGSPTWPVLSSTELFDPVAGSFTPSGNMVSPRDTHTATLLPTGEVLLAGGMSAYSTPTASAELYNPATGICAATTGPMTMARAGHHAVLLASGEVLIIGGTSSLACELYNPALVTFSPTTGSLNFARSGFYGFNSLILMDGRVLISGQGSIGGEIPAEIYDPSTGLFSNTEASMSVPREGVGAALLANGKVLFAGGYNQAVVNNILSNVDYSTAEEFDPTTNTFTVVGMMVGSLAFQGTVALYDGRVLEAGGETNSGLPVQQVFNAQYPAPGFPNISYIPSCYSLQQGAVIHSITPMSNGVTSWSVNPGLPSGLNFNSGTGVISGTPSASTAMQAYTITATNGTNTTSALVWLTID